MGADAARRQTTLRARRAAGNSSSLWDLSSVDIVVSVGDCAIGAGSSSSRAAAPGPRSSPVARAGFFTRATHRHFRNVQIT